MFAELVKDRYEMRVIEDVFKGVQEWKSVSNGWVEKDKKYRNKRGNERAPGLLLRIGMRTTVPAGVYVWKTRSNKIRSLRN